MIHIYIYVRCTIISFKPLCNVSYRRTARITERRWNSRNNNAFGLGHAPVKQCIFFFVLSFHTSLVHSMYHRLSLLFLVSVFDDFFVFVCRMCVRFVCGAGFWRSLLCCGSSTFGWFGGSALFCVYLLRNAMAKNYSVWTMDGGNVLGFSAGIYNIV